MKKFMLPLLLVGALVASVLPAHSQGGTRVYSACGSAAWTALDLGRPMALLPTGELCVNATVNASISGFHWESSLTPLAVTTTTASSAAFTAGKTVIVDNIGATNDIFCRLGPTATTAAKPIKPGTWMAFTSTSETVVACITSTSTSTANIQVGTGLATGAGGSGGSGGGGSVNVSQINGVTPLMGNGATGTGSLRVTLADDNTIPTGWPTAANQATANTALGAPGDSVCGSATGTCSMIALAKYLNNAANSPLPAQTNNAVNIGAVMNAGSTYETIAASQTGQILGGAGAIGDYLSHCVIYPTSTTPGVVTVFDDVSAAGSNVIAFPGGASSVSNLVPISIPVGAVSVTGKWRVTTGANVVVTCYGKFT